MQFKNGWQSQTGKIITYQIVADHANLAPNKEFIKHIKKIRKKES